MPAVAARAEKSVGALYEHFGSKADLLAAVYADYAGRRDDFVRSTFAEAEDAPRDARIANFIEQFTTWYANNTGVLRSFTHSLWSDEDAMTPSESSRFDENIRTVAKYLCGADWSNLTRGQKAGVDRYVSYAIILLREAIVMRVAPSFLRDVKVRKAVVADIAALLSTHLETVLAGKESTR